jgi:hypothetical protein
MEYPSEITAPVIVRLGADVHARLGADVFKNYENVILSRCHHEALHRMPSI